MRTQSFFAAVLASCLTPAASQSLPTLYDALVEAGASNFAAFLQENTNASSLYSSGAIKTVFAPSDSASVPAALSRRADSAASGPSQQQLELQSCRNQVSVAEASSGQNGGQALPMGLMAPELGNAPQKTVTDTRPSNVTNISKRWDLHSVVRRQANATTSATSLLRIEAGLGVVSNVIKGDIPYDGGLIQLTDSYFTFPQPLSSTAELTGQTTFNSLAGSSNLTNTLENTQSVTVFLPSNAAFAAASGSSNVSTTQLISNHVIGGFVGYLPDLTDGLSLTTQTGEVLKVSVRADIWYINDARIVQANLILENGVAHVIDQVLTPTPKTLPVTTSGAARAALLPAVLGVSSLCAPLVTLLALLY